MENFMMGEIAHMKVQLNRQKWFIRVSVVGWLIGIGFFLSGSADMNPIDNLRVRRLALIDSRGVERLILVTQNKQLMFKGEPWDRRSPVSGIILQNAHGDEVGGMATSEDGMAAIVLDSYSDYTKWGGSDRVALFSSADGTAGIALNDLKQQARMLITSGPAIDVDLRLLNQEGQAPIRGKIAADGIANWEPKP